MTPQISTSLSILSNLVESGVPLKEVAQFAGFPASPQKLRSDAVAAVQGVIDAMETENTNEGGAPELQRKLKLWVLAVKRAEPLGPEYVRWVAEHVLEISGSSEQVSSQLLDIDGWVAASLRNQTPQHVFNAIACDMGNFDSFPDHNFVDRPFDADMAVITAIELTNTWREALAKQMQTNYPNFPAPWLPPAVTGPYTITPIPHCADLYREGNTVRYWGIWNLKEKVAAGKVSFYSFRKCQERYATIELVRKGENVELGNVLGFLNSQTTSEVMAVVEPWLQERRGLCFPTRSQRNLDDEVPF